MRDPYIQPSERTIPDLYRELFVINGLAETISIINPETREIYPDALPTGMWPNHLLYYNDRIYIVNSGDNEIEIYDESSFEKIGEIYLGAGSNPWMIIHPEESQKGYVPNFAAGDVAVIDLEDFSIDLRIPVGKGPEGGVYQDGKIYVCNTAWDYQLFDFDEGTVSVIDVSADEVISTLSVGKNPQSAISFPDIEEIHVICTGKNGGFGSDDGEIYIISTPDDTVDQQVLSIGGSPSWTGNSFDRNNNTVYLTGVGGLMSYNYQTREILHGSDDYILSGPDAESDFYSGVAVDELNGTIYSCFYSRDEIVVLSLQSYDILETIEGSDGVQSIYLFEE